MDKTKGLIIKQSDFGEGNRMLTVFTEELGIINAAVYGVKRAKSRQSAASQFLSWAEFMLYFGRGDVASVNSVTSIETFFPIQEDLLKLALSSYLCDITYYAVDKNVPNPAILKLLLNTLYVLAYRDVSARKAKTVFELRLASDMGYMPVFLKCAACGNKKELEYFSAECGGAICRNCHAHGRDDIKVNPASLYAAGYILCANEKKIFSFDISDDILHELSDFSEKYLLYHMERDFSSLIYFKKLLTD